MILMKQQQRNSSRDVEMDAITYPWYIDRLQLGY
jgi:hypothetical protein